MKLFPELDFSQSWIEQASESELREACDKVQKALDEMDNEEDFNSPEYDRLYSLNIELCNAVSKFWSAPKVHHSGGWYLDDDD